VCPTDFRFSLKRSLAIAIDFTRTELFFMLGYLFDQRFYYAQTEPWIINGIKEKSQQDKAYYQRHINIGSGGTLALKGPLNTKLCRFMLLQWVSSKKIFSTQTWYLYIFWQNIILFNWFRGPNLAFARAPNILIRSCILLGLFGQDGMKKSFILRDLP